jgi:hypothetical protein
VPRREHQTLRDLPPAAQSPWRVRFGTDLSGPTAPFGCLIRFRPQNASETLPKFASRIVEGLFVGIHLQPGHKYAGDVLVISLDNFMKPDSATLSGQRKVVIQRVKAAEVRYPMADEDFQFPLHDARANKRKESLKSALEIDDFAPLC